MSPRHTPRLAAVARPRRAVLRTLARLALAGTVAGVPASSSV